MKRFVPWLGGIIGLLVITAAVRQCRHGGAANYQTATITRGPITQAVTATGTLNPVVNVQVGSQVSGNIAKLFVDFNSQVKAGQVVAQIDPALFRATVTQAEGDLASAQATLELAKINATRTQELFARKTSSQADLDQAMANLHAAEANSKIKQSALDKARADLEHCTITSPIDGVVISRSVDVGQTVAASLKAPVIFAELSRRRDWIICGVGASKILSVYASWPTLISISSVAIAFLFSGAVGIFFGFYPARKAAALDPIEALRYE